MTMPRINTKRFYERIAAWVRTTSAKLKQRNWRIWLVIALLTYILTEAIRALVSDASTLLVVWLGQGLWWLTRQPMGAGGLALIAYVGVLVGVSWWQSRPKVEPTSGTPSKPQLTDTDRRIIQDIRTLWNRYGNEAVRQMYSLLQSVTYEVKDRTYWGILLDPMLGRLRKSMEGMTAVVAFDAEASVLDVREHFNEMYSSYLLAIEWFAKVTGNGDVSIEGTRTRDLSQWQEVHFYFQDKLKDLDHDPEHHGSLKIYLRFIDDQHFGELLRNAETPPASRELNGS